MMKAKCEICGRIFSSKKAVHGHMRSHPENTRKNGIIIKPPTSAESGGSPLPRWSVTAKRGRKSTVATATAAVNDLMFLSKSAADSDDDDHHHDMGELCNPQIGEMGIKKKSSRVKKIKEIGNQLKNFAELVENANEKKLYRCNSCDKEFSCHQALGGHKSSHNKTNKTTTLLLDDDLSQIIGQNKRIRDFDLNELPPIDDYDGDQGFQ